MNGSAIFLYYFSNCGGFLSLCAPARAHRYCSEFIHTILQAIAVELTAQEALLPMGNSRHTTQGGRLMRVEMK